MAPSLVKTPPGRWDVSPGPGGTKKAEVWPGPRTMVPIQRDLSKIFPMKASEFKNSHSVESYDKKNCRNMTKFLQF